MLAGNGCSGGCLCQAKLCLCFLPTPILSIPNLIRDLCEVKPPATAAFSWWIRAGHSFWGRNIRVRLRLGLDAYSHPVTLTSPSYWLWVVHRSKYLIKLSLTLEKIEAGTFDDNGIYEGAKLSVNCTQHGGNPLQSTVQQLRKDPSICAVSEVRRPICSLAKVTQRLTATLIPIPLRCSLTTMMKRLQGCTRDPNPPCLPPYCIMPSL